MTRCECLVRHAIGAAVATAVVAGAFLTLAHAREPDPVYNLSADVARHTITGCGRIPGASVAAAAGLMDMMSKAEGRPAGVWTKHTHVLWFGEFRDAEGTPVERDVITTNLDECEMTRAGLLGAGWTAAKEDDR